MRIFKIPAVVLLLIIFLVLVAGGLALAIAFLNSPVDSIPSQGINFKIESGESSDSVFKRLEKEKLIRSALLLKLIAKFQGTESAIKAGSYQIAPGSSTLAIHNLIVEGRQELKRSTITEGWTLRQIAKELEDQGITPSKDFLDLASSRSILDQWGIKAKNVEGFLFPDTYFFTANSNPRNVIHTFLENFFNKLKEIAPDYQSLSFEELYQRVIIASIVEREYRSENEAPVIGSVFYNRLRRGMRLESCATVAYVITDILGRSHPEFLTYDDLKIKSPYNTYENDGLPPGPIGNPGKTALIAAFYPLKSNYLYFVLKDPQAGTHEFSETYTQHVKAIKLYLKKK